MTPHEMSEAQAERARSDLLARELNHRFANDMQLILALLNADRRRARGDEARALLASAIDRVSIVAQRRKAINAGACTDLAAALRHVGAALEAMTDGRAARVTLVIDDPLPPVRAQAVLMPALAANELATNALKHAFGHHDGDREGTVTIAARRRANGGVAIRVSDDGAPFAAGHAAGGDGLDIVRRLVMTGGGLLIPPEAPSKCFEIRVDPPAGEGRG